MDGWWFEMKMCDVFFSMLRWKKGWKDEWGPQPVILKKGCGLPILLDLRCQATQTKLVNKSTWESKGCWSIHSCWNHIKPNNHIYNTIWWVTIQMQLYIYIYIFIFTVPESSTKHQNPSWNLKLYILPLWNKNCCFLVFTTITYS